MSFDIGAVGQPQRTVQPGSAAGTSAPVTASSGDHADAVTVDTLPASPPPELSKEIAAAARAYEDLLASGRRLHFDFESQSGRLKIELSDRDGNVLCTVSPPRALAIAAGGDPT